MNITRYAEINPFTNVSWVWISNYDIVGDFCKVNFTFEYLAGSQVEISFYTCDAYYIYLNQKLLYSNFCRPFISNISSYFGDTGIYYIGIEILHYPGAFGFSFIISENYNCNLSCKQCSSPLTCLSCQSNSPLNSYYQCICDTSYYWNGTSCVHCDATLPLFCWLGSCLSYHNFKVFWDNLYCWCFRKRQSNFHRRMHFACFKQW